MSSYVIFKILHITSVLFVFAALGGLLVRAVDRPTSDDGRRLAGATHGVGLLAVLVTGFGAMAGLGLPGIPSWIWLKLIVWLAIGASLVAIRRLPGQAKLLWLVLPLLGTIAAYLAIVKPGG